MEEPRRPARRVSPSKYAGLHQKPGAAAPSQRQELTEDGSQRADGVAPCTLERELSFSCMSERGSREACARELTQYRDCMNAWHARALDINHGRTGGAAAGKSKAAADAERAARGGAPACPDGMQSFEFEVPPGARPGHVIALQMPDGRAEQVQLLSTSNVGDTVRVCVPLPDV